MFPAMEDAQIHQVQKKGEQNAEQYHGRIVHFLEKELCVCVYICMDISLYTRTFVCSQKKNQKEMATVNRGCLQVRGSKGTSGTEPLLFSFYIHTFCIIQIVITRLWQVILLVRLPPSLPAHCHVICRASYGMSICIPGSLMLGLAM